MNDACDFQTNSQVLVSHFGGGSQVAEQAFSACEKGALDNHQTQVGSDWLPSWVWVGVRVGLRAIDILGGFLRQIDYLLHQISQQTEFQRFEELPNLRQFLRSSGFEISRYLDH